MKGDLGAQLLKLAMWMQDRADGVTISEIMDKFSVSRRTAERWRNAIGELYPLEELEDNGDRQKRWRIQSGVSLPVSAITAEELAELHHAVKTFKQKSMKHQADTLETLYGKIEHSMKSDVRRRVAPDLEALVEAEGLAMRPGPKVDIDKDILKQLRKAIITGSRVWLHYRQRGDKKLIKQLVCPYGFLFGHRHYLVAYSLGVKDYRLWILGNIKRADVTNKTFERDGSFSLQEYAERSFGVFQEEPFDVEWRFKKAVAEDALNYVFHPSQEVTRNKNGTVTVRFKAGGALEMSWHLHTWGDSVIVVKPKDFWDRVRCLARDNTFH